MKTWSSWQYIYIFFLSQRIFFQIYELMKTLNKKTIIFGQFMFWEGHAGGYKWEFQKCGSYEIRVGVLQKDLNGEIIEKFPSLLEAVAKTKLTAKNILNVTLHWHCFCGQRIFSNSPHSRANFPGLGYNIWIIFLKQRIWAFLRHATDSQRQWVGLRGSIHL